MSLVEKSEYRFLLKALSASFGVGLLAGAFYCLASPGDDVTSLRFYMFQSDLIAGITIGLTVIPQSLAYANVAALPIEYGLYSSFVGVLVYMFLGTSKDVTVGPTALQSLLTAQYGNVPNAPLDPTCAIVLSLMAGIVYFFFAFFNLGILVEFISACVLSAFMTATSVCIIVTQLPVAFGIKGLSRDTKTCVIQLLQRMWTDARPGDLILCIVCIVVLNALKSLKAWRPFQKVDTKWKAAIQWLFWMIGTSRNAIVVITATGVSYSIYQNALQAEIDARPPVNTTLGYNFTTSLQPPTVYGWDNVTATSWSGSANTTFASLSTTAVPKPPLPVANFVFTITRLSNIRIPSFRVPKFSIVKDNVTVDSTADLFHVMAEGIFLVPLIGMVEQMAVGTTFARKFKYRMNCAQDMAANSIINILGSFLQNYPQCGSFSRTIVNAESGVMSPISGIYAAALVLLALGVVAPAFYYLPTASLAAVIIAAVASALDFSIVPSIWRLNKVDLIPYWATFLCCVLINVQYGILIGIGINLLVLLYPIARIKLRRRTHPTSIQLEPVQSVKYAANSHVAEKIADLVEANLDKELIIDLRNMNAIDYSTLMGFEILAQEVLARKVVMKFINVTGKVAEKFQLVPVLRDLVVETLPLSGSSGEPKDGLESDDEISDTESQLMTDRTVRLGSHVNAAFEEGDECQLNSKAKSADDL